MKKSAIAIILGALVLLGGGAYAAYSFLTNTPKNLYLLSEQKSMESVQKYVDKRFQNELKFQGKMKDEPFSSAMTLSVDVPEDTARLMGTEKSVIDASSIKIIAAQDGKQEKATLSLIPTIADSEIGNFNWSADKENQYFSSPLFDGILSVPNDKIVDTVNKLTGSDETAQDMTNEMLNLNEIIKGSQISEKEIKELQDRYIKVVTDNLDDKRFTKEKVKTKVFGADKNLEKVTMDLKDKDTKKVILAVLEEAKKDETLKRIIERQGQITNVGKEIGKSIKEVKDKKDSEFPAIVSTIYVDGKNILKRELTMKDKDNKGFELTGDSQIDDNIKVDYSGKMLGEDGSFTLKGDSKGEKDADQDNYVLNADDGTTNTSVIKLKNTSTKDGNKRNDKGNVTLEITNERPYTFDYNNQMDTDVSNNKQKQKADVSFDLNGYPMKLMMDSETTLKSEVKVKADKSKNLNAMSDDELQQLQDEIGQKFGEIVSDLGDKLR